MVISLSRKSDTKIEKSKNTDVLPPLFGTDGIRGKAGELLNAPLALQIGYWAGRVLQENTERSGPVVVGQDSRNSSDMLSMAIASGLTSSGVEVWQVGLCPTPCVAYLTQNSHAIGGIMISASHNPPEDNGIKFFGALGKKLNQKLTLAIETGIRSKLSNLAQPAVWGKSFNRPLLVRDYQEFLQDSLPKNLDFKGKKVVLDLAWGAAVNVAPAIFQALGAQVICLHEKADGDRINVNCGSTHLQRLQNAVKETQADVGFAFDGDADRVMLVDSKGRVVDGDHILYCWGQKLQKQNKLPDNLIIGTVMANLGFERAWQNLGGKLARTAVGDQYVQEMMWQTGAMLGGEQSGHILCHHHNVSGDGIQTALHLTAFLQEEGISLTSWLDQSFQTYPQILRNVRVEDRERRLCWQECAPIQAAINKAEKELGTSGRILVRASGTEPLIRIMVESALAKDAKYWTDYLVNTVQKYLIT